MKPVVTEQTSKRYKGFMLLGGICCCIGVVVMVKGDSPAAGAAFFLGGLITYIAARAGAWWNHG